MHYGQGGEKLRYDSDKLLVNCFELLLLRSALAVERRSSISTTTTTASFSATQTQKKKARDIPKLSICKALIYAKENFVYLYRVSQHVWNGLKAIFWCFEACERSELCFGKNIFCSKKLLFKPFLWTAKMKMEFLSNFAPIVLCSNSFSKLLEIGVKLL